MMRLNLSNGCDVQEFQGKVIGIKKFLNRCAGTCRSEDYGGAKAARKRLLSAGGDFHVIGS